MRRIILKLILFSIGSQCSFFKIGFPLVYLSARTTTRAALFVQFVTFLIRLTDIPKSKTLLRSNLEDITYGNINNTICERL